MVEDNEYFDYDKFMDTVDYISMDDFSKPDQEKIVEYNGCGNIIFHIKTKNDEFEEIWLFNNDDDYIDPNVKMLYEIKPFEISEKKNLELVKEGDLLNIDVSFDYYNRMRLNNISKERENAIKNGEIENKDFMDITLNCLDRKSRDYFKQYHGQGTIIRKIIKRIGRDLRQNYYFSHFVNFELNYNDLTDDTPIYINKKKSSDILLDICPEQNIIKEELIFEPFSKNEYKSLNISLKPNFNYDRYMNNIHEILDSSIFSDEDVQLMFENDFEGLIYYEFITNKNERIRDCFKIANIFYKKESWDYSENIEVTNYNPDEEYVIMIFPYKLNERNNFTIPEIEKFGTGYWYYDENLDFVSLSDFSIKDQKNILNHNGSGNIIVEFTTKDGNIFKELWVFDGEIKRDSSNMLKIYQIESNEEINLLSLSYRDLKEIKYSFELYSKDMIDEILDENEKEIENGEKQLLTSDELNFGLLDENSQQLFKDYSGNGFIIKKNFTRSGGYFEEKWEFDNVDRDVMLSDMDDDTILYISSVNLDNRLNYDFYPIQDFLYTKYSFKPFSKEKIDELSLIEDFNYEDYIENGIEFIDCFEFTDEDNELIKKYRDKRLVYFEFKTIKDEIIRDYYEISKMTKHDFEKELEDLGKEINLELVSDEEIEEFKKDCDNYDLEVTPYKLDERNYFTVPEIDIFGSGHWYYQR